MTPVRIFIADDHEIVREGVRALIRRHDGWRVCGEAATGRETVAKACQLKPDIIVMDIGMPDLDGFDAMCQIKHALPKSEVLVFTAIETEEVVRNIFKSGARAYLLKSDANQHFVRAIEALCEHRTYFSSKTAELIFAACLKREARTVS